MKLGNMQELYEEQLEAIFSAEQRVVKVLPQMARAATNSQLKNTFTNQLVQVKEHLGRLQRIFSKLAVELRPKSCMAMDGLIQESTEMIQGSGNPEVKDAGLIACLQRIQHYEIAAYGTARTFAYTVGQLEAGHKLQQILDEVGAEDKLLTTIATTIINPTAALVQEDTPAV